MASTTEIASTMGSASSKAKLPRPGAPGKLGFGIPVVGATVDAFSRINNGEKAGSAIGKAVGRAVLDDLMLAFLGPEAVAAMFVAQLAVAGAGMAIENGKKNTTKLGKAMGGSKESNVINSNSAVTMRQRGMAMINQNGEATRSALGSEARTYFRNSMY